MNFESFLSLKKCFKAKKSTDIAFKIDVFDAF